MPQLTQLTQLCLPKYASINPTIYAYLSMPQLTQLTQLCLPKYASINPTNPTMPT